MENYTPLPTRRDSWVFWKIGKSYTSIKNYGEVERNKWVVEEHPDKLAVIRADLVTTNNDWDKWDFARLTEKETYFRKGLLYKAGPDLDSDFQKMRIPDLSKKRTLYQNSFYDKVSFLKNVMVLIPNMIIVF